MKASRETWFIAALHAIVDDRSLPWRDKLVAIILARRCDGRGVCTVPLATIARETGLSEPSVKRAITSLVAAGKLVKEARYSPDNQRMASTFRVRMPVASMGGGK